MRNTDHKIRFALQLIEAGLGEKLVCKAASISAYEYNQVIKGLRPIHNAA